MLAPSTPTKPTLQGRTAIILTVSDRCHAGTQTDLSGPAVSGILTSAGATVLEALTLPDELDLITNALRLAAAGAALIVTTGGTGLAPRDVTPEATLAVCDRLIPGVSELIRQDGLHHTPFAALGRGICGTSGTALILNLPGNPAGAASSLRAVLHLLPHSMDLLANQTDSHPSTPDR